MTNNHVFSQSETKKAIEIKQLRKEFDGKLVLSDVFFDVFYGTIHGFVGPNGAGKSTTLNILTRLVLPTSGEVLVEGRSVADDPYFNESLGFVEAEPKFPDFTVEKYVEVCSYLRGVPKQEA
jgi:ABC-2 type transport system ATP-binding protein